MPIAPVHGPSCQRREARGGRQAALPPLGSGRLPREFLLRSVLLFKCRPRRMLAITVHDLV